MKKISLSLALFSIVACNDSDELPSIIGKWKITKVEFYNSSYHETNTIIFTGCQAESTEEYKKTDITTIVYGMKNDICLPLQTWTKNYIYDKVGQKYWYEGEEHYPFTILQLTDKNMITEDHSVDFDNNGVKDVVIRYFVKVS